MGITGMSDREQPLTVKKMARKSMKEFRAIFENPSFKQREGT